MTGLILRKILPGAALRRRRTKGLYDGGGWLYGDAYVEFEQAREWCVCAWYSRRTLLKTNVTVLE